MKYLKGYRQHVDEMAEITRKGKKVYADGRLLKELTAKELDDNIALLYIGDKGGFMFPPGKFWLYFVDSNEWISKFNAQEYEMLMFPFRGRYNMFDEPPITSIWKKKHLNKTKGSEHILGIVEGTYDKDKGKTYIEMMSVKPQFHRNRINAIMIDSLKDSFKGSKLVWVDPSDAGLEFIRIYDKDPEFLFTVNGRPKKFQEYYPDQAAKHAPKIEAGS